MTIDLNVKLMSNYSIDWRTHSLDLNVKIFSRMDLDLNLELFNRRTHRLISKSEAIQQDELMTLDLNVKVFSRIDYIQKHGP